MTRPSSAPLRRRGVLGAVVAAALRGLPAVTVLATAAARAAEAQLTTFDVIRDEDGLHLSYAIDFELGLL